MDDTSDAAAEREFRQAVVDELHKLVARGVEHGEAVDVLLRRLCGGALRPNAAEVAALTGSLGYTRQDAVRALVVREELRALKAQGLDNAAATRQLTHRVRREEATAAHAASSQTLPDQQPLPIGRQPLREQQLPTPAYGADGAANAEAAPAVAESAPQQQPGVTWGYCNGPAAVASQSPQAAGFAGSRGAAPAWAASNGGVGGVAELKAPRTTPSRKRSAPTAVGVDNDSGQDPMDADGEPEVKRRRAVRPPSPHHLHCYHAAHHGFGSGGLGTGYPGAGGGGGGCGGVHGCSSCKRARSPGRDDGSGGGGGGGGAGGGGGGGGHHKRHRTS